MTDDRREEWLLAVNAVLESPEWKDWVRPALVRALAKAREQLEVTDPREAVTIAEWQTQIRLLRELVTDMKGFCKPPKVKEANP